MILHLGVSVLHVIAEPFPRVWHTLGVRINVLSNMAYSCFVILFLCSPALTWLF
jgi:hypothetical protein